MENASCVIARLWAVHRATPNNAPEILHIKKIKILVIRHVMESLEWNGMESGWKTLIKNRTIWSVTQFLHPVKTSLGLDFARSGRVYYGVVNM
jgi:hypothetical protein